MSLFNIHSFLIKFKMQCQTSCSSVKELNLRAVSKTECNFSTRRQEQKKKNTAVLIGTCIFNKLNVSTGLKVLIANDTCKVAQA